AGAVGTPPMATPRDEILVDHVLVGVDLLPGITLGDAFPHQPSCRRVALAQGEGEGLRRLKRPREPQPDGVRLAADEGPQFITFDGIASGGGQDALFKGRERLDFFLVWRRW